MQTQPEPRGEGNTARRGRWRGTVGDGLLDQRGRRFTSSEYRIARTLADRGHGVVAVAESPVFRQKSPDADVDGEPTEFKTLDPGATHQTVNDCLGRAKAQAPNVVVDGRGSGLTERDARRGLVRFVGAHAGRVRSIRVLGEGFELGWQQGTEV